MLSLACCWTVSISNSFRDVASLNSFPLRCREKFSALNNTFQHNYVSDLKWPGLNNVPGNAHPYVVFLYREWFLFSVYLVYFFNICQLFHTLAFILCYFFLNIGQCIYLGLEYIRGVTVHKIHGSVRYDTVVSRFGPFSIRGGGGLGQLVMSQCFFKPWRRANGYHTSTRLHQGLHNAN